VLAPERPDAVTRFRGLRELTPEAIAALVKVMTKGKSEAARVAAANALLDRGWGRPKPSDEPEASLRCRTSASLEQSGMAGEVRTECRADGGIGADPIKVI